MGTLVLSQSEIRELLPMDACMGLMEDVLQSLDRGEALNPLRWAMRLGPQAKPGSILGMMPGATDDPRTVGLKVVTVMPGNHGTNLDTHQGLVALFDPDTGVPLAILDGSEITATRTAAVSGVATRALARTDAGDLAILGSGVQARTHLAAMAVARDLRRVRVFSPSRQNREAFAERESKRHGMTVEAVGSARDAVEGADLVCTTTSAREPVLMGEWLAPGCHVNAAGACVPKARELDTQAVVRSRLYVDRRESLLNEAGDFLIPRDEGAVGDDHLVGELGALLAGKCTGRRSDDEITLFESLGIAVEDLATAHYLVGRAREAGVGTEVDLGGLRE